MGTVKVGEDVYGWGGDAKELPNDPHAYGPKLLEDMQVAELAHALNQAGWQPFTKMQLEERQVFLIAPKQWRRPVSIKGLPGQILQVRELPKKAEPPPPPPPPKPVDTEAPTPPEGVKAPEAPPEALTEAAAAEHDAEAPAPPKEPEGA